MFRIASEPAGSAHVAHGTVRAWDVWLEVEDRRAVKGVNVLHVNYIVAYPHDLTERRRDQIRPHGRACGEDACQWIGLVAARVDLEDAPFLRRIVLVKLPEHVYVREAFETEQRRGVRRGDA